MSLPSREPSQAHVDLEQVVLRALATLNLFFGVTALFVPVFVGSGEGYMHGIGLGPFWLELINLDPEVQGLGTHFLSVVMAIMVVAVIVGVALGYFITGEPISYNPSRWPMTVTQVLGVVLVVLSLVTLVVMAQHGFGVRSGGALFLDPEESHPDFPGWGLLVPAASGVWLATLAGAVKRLRG
ncbi:hypothetical protein ACQBAU_05980 [Propionibacteriaceae bacterium Y2011]|uniref:hypothetical protein n=1 Tax=Microlunatus sp. Y2014 TaxID=3418488 RepID=UPI003B4CCCAA